MTASNLWMAVAILSGSAALVQIQVFLLSHQNEYAEEFQSVFPQPSTKLAARAFLLATSVGGLVILPTIGGWYAASSALHAVALAVLLASAALSALIVVRSPQRNRGSLWALALFNLGLGIAGLAAFIGASARGNV